MKYLLTEKQINRLSENTDEKVFDDFKLIKRFLEGRPPKFPVWVKGYELKISNGSILFIMKVNSNILPSQTDEVLDEIWQRIYIFTGVPVSLHLERL